MSIRIPEISFSNIVADTNDVLAKNGTFWLGVFLVYYVPLALFQSWTSADTTELFTALLQGNMDRIEEISREQKSYPFLTFLVGLINMLFFSFNAWAVFRMWGNEKYEVGELLQIAVKKWPWVLVTALLLVVLLILPFLFFVIPGIFLAVCWSMSLYFVLFLDLTFVDALKASYDMVIKKWWTIFLLILGAILTIILVSVLLGIMLFWAPDAIKFTVQTIVSAYFNVFWVVVFLHIYNYTYPPTEKEAGLDPDLSNQNTDHLAN